MLTINDLAITNNDLEDIVNSNLSNLSLTVDLIGNLKTSLAFTNDNEYKLLLFVPITGGSGGYNVIVPWDYLKDNSVVQADWYGSGDNTVIKCVYSYNKTNNTINMSVINYTTAPSVRVYGIK